MHFDLKRWISVMLAVSLSLIFSFVTINHFDGLILWLSKLTTAFSPFIIGLLIAYLLDPLIKGLVKVIKIKRGISIALIYLFLLIIIGGFGWLVVPLVIENASQIIADAPNMIDQANTQIADSGILSDPSVQEALASIRGRVVEWANLLLSNLTQILKGITSAIFNMVIGIVVSIYTLIDKQRLQALSIRVVHAMFNDTKANSIFDWLRKIHHIFSKF